VNATGILFVTASSWKQPKCPSIGEWIHKLWENWMKYYSAMKMCEIQICAATWMRLRTMTVMKTLRHLAGQWLFGKRRQRQRKQKSLRAFPSVGLGLHFDFVDGVMDLLKMNQMVPFKKSAVYCTLIYSTKLIKIKIHLQLDF
jgi:hypothetical protein